MLKTAYFLCHGHWTVIPRQLEENFNDMRQCGFDAVALSFSEGEAAYSRRAVEIQVKLARKAGLLVFFIPSRWGNRFAGAPLAPSPWAWQHPESWIPDPHYRGWLGPLVCVNSTAFRHWAKGFAETLIRDYEPDGFIWDEPKDVSAISNHPDTLAKYGNQPSAENMHESFADFLAELTAHCRRLREGLTMTLFCQKTDPEDFTRRAAAVNGLDYFGYDGNLARQSRFHEEPKRAKYRIESVWRRTLEECETGGKKTFALIENMLMPAAAVPEYEANLEAYLQNHRPDHLAFYYYAHNNEDPEAVHAATTWLMKKHLAGGRSPASRANGGAKP